MGPTLGQLTRLTSVNLSSDRFVSGNIAQTLRLLPNLQVLDLSNCEWITEETMPHISGLTGLRYLDLAQNQVCRDRDDEIQRFTLGPLCPG